MFLLEKNAILSPYQRNPNLIETVGNVKIYIFDVSDKLRVFFFNLLGGMQNSNFDIDTVG